MRQRVLICGGRDWENISPIMGQLRKLPRNSIIINGGSRGADTLAKRAVKILNKDEGYNFWIWTCPADWEMWDKIAGPQRNQAMLDEAQPSLLIALPGGTGTLDMTSRAHLAGLVVIEVQSE